MGVCSLPAVLRLANGHCPHLSVSNCASAVNEPHQPRRKERVNVRLVRPRVSFDQLESVVQSHVLPRLLGA